MDRLDGHGADDERSVTPETPFYLKVGIEPNCSRNSDGPTIREVGRRMPVLQTGTRDKKSPSPVQSVKDCVEKSQETFKEMDEEARNIPTYRGRYSGDSSVIPEKRRLQYVRTYGIPQGHSTLPECTITYWYHEYDGGHAYL